MSLEDSTMPPAMPPRFTAPILEDFDDRHPCPVRGCHAIVHNTKLMCLPHWRQVPLPLQRDVNRTWRAHCNPNARGTLRPYVLARRAAIDAVSLQAPLL